MNSIVASLPFLACPVGMGLMMWVMMRNKKDDAPAPPAPRATSVDGAAAASVELLREEHRRLGEQIESLEAAERTEANP